MAFGQTSKKLGEKKSASTGDGTVKEFTSPNMPLGLGIRKFQWLPELNQDGTLVMFDRLTASGSPLKVKGKVQQHSVPAEEFAFLSAWWDVMVGGQPAKRRLILDINNRWDNPLWKHIQANFKKGDIEWGAIKQVFAANVFDMSQVVQNAKGWYFYDSTGKGKYDLSAYGANGKIVTKDEDLPESDAEAFPLNKVRIIEASYGPITGKSLFAAISGLHLETEDSEGLARSLTEFPIKLKTSGKGIDTTRAVNAIPTFGDLPLEVAQLPRYDLSTWLKPWPNEMIQSLLDGEDFNEMVEHYSVQMYPTIANTGDTQKLDTDVVDTDKDTELFD
jgi:hypothetical protein